ncbi:hypothetical protein [Algoriphagus boritolerans]|uniref:hypothetical protein n=1 Tax=Algoriphagus boritolerans TaxID=308111 RepID=UPI000AA008E8
MQHHTKRPELNKILLKSTNQNYGKISVKSRTRRCFRLGCCSRFCVYAALPVQQYGQDPTTGIWYDLTGVDPAPDTYSCESNPSRNCRVDAPNQFGMPIDPLNDSGKELNVIHASKLTEV